MTKEERDRARYATDAYRDWNRERMRRMRETPEYQAHEQAYRSGVWVQLRHTQLQRRRRAIEEGHPMDDDYIDYPNAKAWWKAHRQMPNPLIRLLGRTDA